ncbi:MAG: hypothetical protein K8S27_07155 [Candidatus Omnitrophica bacterium]|nr:hypothetical protein [Candidatus Omnitrophota bacterium]
MRNKNIAILFFFIIGTGLFLFILSVFFDASFSQLILSINRALSLRNHNLCPAGKLNDINVFHLIYQFSIFLVFLCLSTKHFVHHSKYNLFADMELTDILKQVAFFVIGILMLIQTMNLSLTAKKHLDQYAGLNTGQKYQKVLGDKYSFSQFVHQQLPAESTVGILSEKNLSSAQWMTAHRQLAYFLYPLDMREVRKEEINAYIIIGTTDPERMIPEGYQLTGTFNKDNIVAIRTAP